MVNPGVKNLHFHRVGGSSSEIQLSSEEFRCNDQTSPRGGEPSVAEIKRGKPGLQARRCLELRERLSLHSRKMSKLGLSGSPRIPLIKRLEPLQKIYEKILRPPGKPTDDLKPAFEAFQVILSSLCNTDHSDLIQTSSPRGGEPSVAKEMFDFEGEQQLSLHTQKVQSSLRLNSSPGIPRSNRPQPLSDISNKIPRTPAEPTGDLKLAGIRGSV